jgi:hypothetical protein
MGYTTSFQGAFRLNKPLTLAHTALLQMIHDDGSDMPQEQWDELTAEAKPSKKKPKLATRPNGYCQWMPTKDRRGICWDGAEKFRDYPEWLQFLIDNILEPWGYTLSGEVQYQGEDRSDYGILRVTDGEVDVVKNPTKAWKEIPAAMRERVIGSLEELASNDFTTDVFKAFQSAMALLREAK